MAGLLVQLLTNIADAIREKKGTTDKINAQNMAFEIKSIEPPLDTIELKDPGKYDVKDYKYAQVLPSDVLEDFIGVLQGTATEVHIPEGTTKLRQSAFWGDKKINIYIPTSVTSISGGLFTYSTTNERQYIYYAGSLEEWVEMKSGISHPHYLYIDNELVTEISTLTEYTANASGSNSMLGYIIVDKIFIPNGSTIGARGLSSVRVTNEIIFEGTINGELGERALGNVNDLNTGTQQKNFKLILPTNITKIPRSCFEGSYLEELTIPEGVTTLEYNCFNGAQIKNLILPSTLQTMEKTNLSRYNLYPTIVIYATTPPTAAANIFGSGWEEYLPKVIFIPAGTITAYQTATNWALYADLFVEMNAISLNAQAEILNNETYQYSTDGGVTWFNFTSEITNLEQIGLIKFKNTIETTKLLIGKTAGATDIGSITDAELTYVTEGSMTIYLRLEEITA